MSWYDEMVAAGRSKSLTTGNVRWVAAVHEVLGSLALETPVNCHSELMEDSLRNIEPVQLGVEQMRQASVELPSITDDTGCGIQQTLVWGSAVSSRSWSRRSPAAKRISLLSK